MARCEICDKSVSFGNKLSITRSHISKRTTRTWKPNLRKVKAVVDGEHKRINVCTKCLRSGKVERVKSTMLYSGVHYIGRKSPVIHRDKL